MLAQKQTRRSMGQEREPRDKPTHLRSTNPQQWRQEYTVETTTVSSASGVQKVGQPRVNQHTLTPTQNKLKTACVCVSHLVVSTLWGSMDCSPPGSSVHGILHARTLEWVAISFSRESSQPRDQSQVSCTAGRCFTI